MKTSLLSTLLVSATLAALTTVAAAADTGTVVIINTSAHRTGKIEVREGKTPIANVGQHQWTEVAMSAGEHVIYPKLSNGREVVVKIEPGKRTYILMNFRYSVLDAYIELRETNEVEGEHWMREWPDKKLEIKAAK